MDGFRQNMNILDEHIMYQRRYIPGKGTIYFFADNYPTVNNNEHQIKDIGYDLKRMHDDIMDDLTKFAKNMPDCVDNNSKITIIEEHNCYTVNLT